MRGAISDDELIAEPRSNRLNRSAEPLKSFRAVWRATRIPRGLCGRTYALDLSICRCAIHRLDSANNVRIYAVFFASPRYCTFVYPNWRLNTRNGWSTLARTLAFQFS